MKERQERFTDVGEGMIAVGVCAIQQSREPTLLKRACLITVAPGGLLGPAGSLDVRELLIDLRCSWEEAVDDNRPDSEESSWEDGFFGNRPEQSHVLFVVDSEAE